ncbi:MoaD/ThiS family protein [Desulfogranum marinum]|jgi:molybdopterin converting factor small subunit|uniref:MoaD/ThiS family protein n=1 Tax=Desulfogranum marinum TaxID=453220 RepID=UPI0019650876|nr:MoaD/ThiS family protein [Desulfogranum marinum]MBM9514282.1 MoaD/ThiS family protein [Desulfogranum marinum]
MKITVKLFAYFRDNRFIKQEQDLPPGTTVRDIINSLEIDIEEIGVTMINSRHCQFDQEIQAGDQVAIFPAIGGG